VEPAHNPILLFAEYRANYIPHGGGGAPGCDPGDGDTATTPFFLRGEDGGRYHHQPVAAGTTKALPTADRPPEEFRRILVLVLNFKVKFVARWGWVWKKVQR